MALTELQLPAKTEFYNILRQSASEMDRLMAEWARLSEFIAKVDASDLDAMGVATGQVRTDLIQFRDMLDEMILLYNGDTVTPSNNPSAVVDKIRRMI